MPSIVLTDVAVKFGTQDVSAQVQSITLNYKSEAVVDSAMGQTTTSRVGGLFDWDVSVQFKQDFATGGIDALLWSMIGQTAVWEGKPTSAAASADNPRYHGTAFYESYDPLAGAHGELAKSTVKLLAAGPLSRSITP